ncbi:MAG: DNA gyrase subunit A, partial [Chloroflexi bacterium]|nr:DNA gyrase subunit A [Chloroflexota bacterium]
CLVADTHDTLLFFTSRGRVYPLKCHRIPQDTSRTAKGTPVINLLPLDDKEQITTAVIAKFQPGNFMVMATAKGKIKRTSVAGFASLRGRGLIAISLGKGDELVSVGLAKEDDSVILVTEKGRAIRFAVNEFRALSRSSQGVRGIRLDSQDKMVSMEIAYPNAHLLTVTSKGYGKFTSINAYPVHHRGGKGITSHRVSQKVGRVVAAKQTSPSGELMLISNRGVIIRVPKKSINIQGRSTQGVSLMKLDSGNEVIAIDSPLEEDTADDSLRQNRGLQKETG